MSLTKMLSVLVISLLIGACATSSQPSDYGSKSQDVPKKEPEPKVEAVKIKIDLTDEQKELAKEAVRGELKDPESAQFTELFGISSESFKSGFSVCGYVNAKNSYGGYVGKKPFGYINGSVLMPKSGSSSAALERKLMVDMCTPNAMPEEN